MISMNALQQWMRCPDHIDIDDGNGPIRLHKRDDLYALRGSVPKQVAEIVQAQPFGDDIRIARGRPAPGLVSGLEVLPVYSATEGATPAVATNRIFLRLDEDTTIESVRGELEALDFSVTDILTYAPHSAWLKPASGRVDEALLKLDSLRALSRAVHVEPQLLRPRAWKNDT